MNTSNIMELNYFTESNVLHRENINKTTLKLLIRINQPNDYLEGEHAAEIRKQSQVPVQLSKKG